MNINYLDWDSNFFQTKIGKVILENTADIDRFLLEAKENKYKLIYLFSEESCIIDDKFLLDYNGILADRKVLYSKFINDSVLLPTLAVEYKFENLTTEIENLAYQSGIYSRFKTDSNFNSVDFFRLYKLWAQKSISHEIADYVFCVNDNGITIGFVTLKIMSNLGHIGLIAVSDDHRGKGIGTHLINACVNKLIELNIGVIDVPTQLQNKEACSFYKKCGFEIKSITNIYHFWIK